MEQINNYCKKYKIVIPIIVTFLAILRVLKCIYIVQKENGFAYSYYQQYIAYYLLVAFLVSLVAWMTYSKVADEKIFLLLSGITFVFSNINILNLEYSFTGYASDWNFGDFANVYVDYYADGSVYGRDYPPVAICIYKLFQKFVQADTMQSGEGFAYAISILMMVTLLFSVCMLIKIFGQKNVLYKNLLAVALIFSGPFLFAIERGNLVIVAFLFTLIFAAYEDSDNPKERFMADICLGIAANIKMYPAIYGLILLKKKKWRDAVVAFLSGIIIWFIPALFIHDGSVGNIMNTFFGEHAMTQWVLDDTLALKYYTYRILLNHGMTNEVTMFKIGSIVLMIFIVITLVSFFCAKEKELEYLFITMLAIYIPSYSFWYILIFLLIPFSFYEFNTQNVIAKCRFYCYFLVFVMAFGNHFSEWLHPWDSQWRVFIIWTFAVVQIILPPIKQYISIKGKNEKR